MSEENNGNTPDITELIKSLKAENTPKNDIGGEDFPFSQEFDMDAFMAANDTPLEKPSAAAAKEEETTMPIEEPAQELRRAELSASDNQDISEPVPSAMAEDFNYSFEGDAKDDSIRSLEAQITELENRLEESAKENTFSTAINAAYNKTFEDTIVKGSTFVQPRPADDFYKNISNTINTLKGTLEDKSNLRYMVSYDTIDSLKGTIETLTRRVKAEETVRGQERSLINRLRDKTGKLKDINLTLNSEIQKTKGEKLEALRQSAQKTKELLSMRMQLSKVEEKVKYGELQLSKMEQNLFALNEQKQNLDDELAAIRQSKLETLRHSAQQTKDIMLLRMELAKTEEKFRFEETTSAKLKEALDTLRAQKYHLDEEVFATRAERDAAKRQGENFQKEIADLQGRIDQSNLRMQQEAVEAGKLRENILSLETKIQLLAGEKASALVRLEEQAKELENVRGEYQRKIETLRAEQIKEVESLRDQKQQESQAITLELKRAEDKYRQEELFVNTLKLQIQSLQNDVKSLDEQKKSLEGKSTDLAFQIDAIKEAHSNEAQNLRNELAAAEEKFKKERQNFNALREQLDNVEAEASRLNNQIKKILAEKDEALAQNEAYLRQIEGLKKEHGDLENNLRQELQTFKQKYEQEAAELASTREKLTKELENAKSSFTLHLDGINKAQEEERARLAADKEQFKQQLLAERDGERQRLTSEKEDLKNRLIAERDSDRQQFESEKQSLKSQLVQEKQNFEEEKQQLSSKFAKEKETLESIFSAQKQQMGDEFAQEKQSLSEQFVQEKQSLSEQFAREKQSLSEQFAKDKEGLESIFAAEKEELQNSIAEGERQRAQFLADIENIKAVLNREKDAAIAAGKQELATAIKAKDDERNWLLAEKEAAKNKIIAEKNKQIEDLVSQKNSQSDLNATLTKQMSEKAFALVSAENALKEKEVILSALKNDLSSLINEKVLIESELKKTSDERVDILGRLEAKTKELEAFQQKHQQEMLALKEQKDREYAALETRLNMVNDRLKAEEENAEALRTRIATLEDERTTYQAKVYNTQEEQSSNAKRMALQAQEIVGLKSQLSEAEGRSVQDNALLKQLKGKIELLETDKAVLESQINLLKKENENLKATIKEQEEQIETLQRVLASTEETLQQEQETVKQLQEHTAKLKAVNFALDREVKKVRKEKVDALRKSAEQAQEILLLREELSKADNGSSTLSFENGIISIRKEYEEKIEKIESELEQASALCAKQVKEIQSLQTDNERLKLAEQQKLKLESEYETLTQKAQSLEDQLRGYEDKTQSESSLMQVKFAALSAQINKINKDKAALKDQLEHTLARIAELEADDRQAKTAFEDLKTQISTNDALIEKLKKDIVKLTVENKDLKENAQINSRRQQVLEAKISEVEEENRTLTGTLTGTLNTALKTSTATGTQTIKTVAAQPAAKTEVKAQPAPKQPLTEKPLPSVKPAAVEPKPAPVEAKPQAAQPQAQSAKPAAQAEVKTEVKQPVVEAHKQQPAAEKTQTKTAAKTATGKAVRTVTSVPVGKAAKANPESSILDFGDETDEMEVVDVESQDMDLSMIFGEETFREDDPERLDAMQNVENAVKPMTLKTGPISDATTRMDLPRPTVDEQDPFDELEMTDHSANQHRIIRKPVGRVPHSYRSEGYSDFLKKTKSIFFRIKWSVFKD